MNVKIEINGLPKDNELPKIRIIIDKLLKDQFQSYKFSWEENKGLVK